MKASVVSEMLTHPWKISHTLFHPKDNVNVTSEERNVWKFKNCNIPFVPAEHVPLSPKFDVTVESVNDVTATATSVIHWTSKTKTTLSAIKSLKPRKLKKKDGGGEKRKVEKSGEKWRNKKWENRKRKVIFGIWQK